MKKNKYKCGVYLLTGFPNAGKSTLINLLTKNKVSIVSPKVQTTQVNITGVLNSHTTQLIFTDTPGLVFEKKYKNKDISRSVLDKEMFIDYNIFVMDIQKSISKVTLSQIEKVNKKFKKNILVLNKIDLLDHCQPRIDRNEQGLPVAVWCSAAQQVGFDLISQAMGELLGRDVFEQEIILGPRDAKLRSLLYELGAVTKERVTDTGDMVLAVRLQLQDFKRTLAQAAIHESRFIEPSVEALQLPAS